MFKVKKSINHISCPFSRRNKQKFGSTVQILNKPCKIEIQIFNHLILSISNDNSRKNAFLKK
ncbi:hypothetical protein BpHYR1_042682, partial [Brachionus plicatilis]